jgi:hypothetical protein
MKGLIFCIGVWQRDGNGKGFPIAQIDFEPDTAKDFMDLPFNELARRYLEPAVARLRAEVEVSDVAIRS